SSPERQVHRRHPISIGQAYGVIRAVIRNADQVSTEAMRQSPTTPLHESDWLGSPRANCVVCVALRPHVSRSTELVFEALTISLAFIATHIYVYGVGDSARVIISCAT
ncbi:MAG: hypothetical protein AAF968_15385, partial [Pseudomonadota bacterium]